MPDIRVEIAPDAEPDGDPSLWQWLDISEYRRQSANVDINYGRDDEASAVEPGDSSLVVDLRDGLLVARNPLSALYGRIGVNTPIRYRLRVGYDDYARTVVGGWGSTPEGFVWSAGGSYNAVNSGSGKVALTAANTASEAVLTGVAAADIDVVYSVSLSAVTTGAPWVSAVRLRRVDTSTHYRLHTELKPAGVITVKIVRVVGGVASDLAEDLTVTGTYSPGSKVWTRAQALAGTIRVKAWTGVLADEPVDWNVVASDAEVEGAGFSFYQWRLSGNTNVGTMTGSLDDLAVDAVLWEGNVPEWSPTWDKSGEDSTATIVAAGPLRRLSAGNAPVKSPLTQQLGAYGPAGWWPVEDESGSLLLANMVPGGQPATIRDVSPAADSEALAGSAAMAKIDSNAALVVGRCKNVTYTAWAGMVFYKFPIMPSSDIRLIEFESAGTIRWWQLYCNASGFQLLGYDTNNTILITSSVSLFTINPLNAFSIQLEAKQNGGNIDWAFIWNEVGKTPFYASTGSVAGTAGRPLGFKINGVTYPDAFFGQVWMGPETLPYVDPDFLAVSAGYAGETARERTARLCLEGNIPLALYAGTSEPLGRQVPGNRLDLVKDAVKADVGLLFERGNALGVVPRGGRYNRPVAMALDWSGGDLAEAPKPTDDDQRLRNEWTIARVGGSEATGRNDESVLARGLIPDADEVNIELDERLAQYVGWYLNLTTYDDFRWPVIEIDLIAHPELIPSFLACRVGSRLTIDNPKSQVPGITIDLLIEGIKQSIGRHRWKVTLSCSPALPWDVATYDDLSKRKDSRASTLNATYNAAASSMVVTFTSLRDQWSQTNEPYLWNLAGETVRVDSMGAVSGSGPYTQTASVTRAINGVAKGHAAGDPVHIHPTQLARYAL